METRTHYTTHFLHAMNRTFSSVGLKMETHPPFGKVEPKMETPLHPSRTKNGNTTSFWKGGAKNGNTTLSIEDQNWKHLGFKTGNTLGSKLETLLHPCKAFVWRKNGNTLGSKLETHLHPCRQHVWLKIGNSSTSM